LRILHEGHASSQEEIVAALREAGHDVTQATVSRDLSEVGASKVRTNGGYEYRLPDEIPRSGSDLMARNLLRTLDEFAIDVVAAGNLVVVRTAPGHASAVARSIDLGGVNEVVGTIAGDDTIFVATPGPEAAASLATRWTEQALEVS
jgi:transcriptional regulator of arginine metabolism